MFFKMKRFLRELGFCEVFRENENVFVRFVVWDYWGFWGVGENVGIWYWVKDFRW